MLYECSEIYCIYTINITCYKIENPLHSQHFSGKNFCQEGSLVKPVVIEICEAISVECVAVSRKSLLYWIDGFNCIILCY